MTKSDYKKWVDDNFTFLAISDAYSLIDYIFEKGFEAKTCDGCQYESNDKNCYRFNDCIRDNIRYNHIDRFAPKTII